MKRQKFDSEFGQLAKVAANWKPTMNYADRAGRLNNKQGPLVAAAGR